MKIYPFQAVYPDKELIASEESFFGRVKYDYPEFEQSGFFKKTSREAIYVYEITRNGNRHLGFFACIATTDYDEGLILKHENTLAANEQKMMQLILHRKAMVKPVLLTYPRRDVIHDFLENLIKKRTPFLELDFKEEKSLHRVWQIAEGEAIEFLHQEFLSNIPALYVADGHHRCSTLAKLNKSRRKKDKNLHFDRTFTAFFSFDQLQIHEYNRSVDILDSITPTRLMAELAKYCHIHPAKGPFRPKAIHELGMLINHEWYSLTWKKRAFKQFPKDKITTDTQMLNTLILEGILGIKDVRNDERIKYIEGIRELEGLLQKTLKNDTRIGFALYPLPMADFKAVADANDVLPPKSTWFEPRMKNGLLVHELYHPEK